MLQCIPDERVVGLGHVLSHHDAYVLSRHVSLRRNYGIRDDMEWRIVRCICRHIPIQEVK
jgi:hypothetical protein